MPHAWDESLATGVASVDEQHRHLIELLNQLVRAMDAGQSRNDVGEILDGLRRYAAGHFSHEEECMARFECPAAAQNAREHREFAGILASFIREFEATGGSAKLALRVENQLAWWLENHIRTTDVQLLPCVRRRSAAAADVATAASVEEARRVGG